MTDGIGLFTEIMGAGGSPALNRALWKYIEAHIWDMRPTWHALGFVHVKLAEENGETFRLHLWLPGEGHKHEQQDKIHDHLFDLESAVLSGAVWNILYGFKEDITGSHRIVRVQYGEKSSQLVETGVTGFPIEIDRQLIIASESYSIPKAHFHQTLIDGNSPALTLVKTLNPIIYEPAALLTKELPLPSARSPIACDIDYWASFLKPLLQIDRSTR